MILEYKEVHTNGSILMENIMCKTADLLVLVVEPDVKVLENTCDSLGRLGIEKTICVNSYSDAVAALHANPNVDIVIADFAIEPDKALGVLLCGTVKKKHPGMFFVLISKDFSCSVVLDSFGVGAEDILDKTRKDDIDNLMGKWITLAKHKNTLKEILDERIQ